MLDRFIADYSEKGYQFAFRLCGNAEEARELVQETFVRVMSKWDQYDPAQSLEGYFISILRNLYYDGLRRFDRRNLCSLDAPPEADGAALSDRLADGEEALLDRLERREAEEQVQTALKGLAAEQRAILELSDVQGLSYDQIAAVLDCPVGTVRSRLSRARRALREKLLTSSEVVNR